MKTATDEHKTGEALNAQRFRMLEDLAKDLAGEVAFPTHFDLTLQLRDLLKDQAFSVEALLGFVQLDPLLAGKLVGLASSEAVAREEAPVKSLRGAITTLGVAKARTVLLDLINKQLLRSKNICDYTEIARELWEHALESAAACQVVARRFGRINPEEAMLAGLVHDLGACYMLYRASTYEELRNRAETLKHLVMQWHESIGESLLHALGVPEDTIDAIHEHDTPRELPAMPRSLNDVVYIGNLLAGAHFEWLYKDLDRAAFERERLGETYLSLVPEIKDTVAQMRKVLAG